MLTRRAFQILPLAGLFAAGCAQGATSSDETSSALSANNGYSNGYNNGYNNGWSNGYNNGYNNSWNNGWVNGWSNGYNNGYNNSWTTGYKNTWSNGWVNGADPTSQSVQGDGTKFLTRGRVEDGRHMVDACIVPSAVGLASCPSDLNAQGQCCRRAMAMQGVYWADLTQTGWGRQINWVASATVKASNGVSGAIDTTLVLDPCYTVGGVRTCDATPNHLWDLAGPGAPLYPDCSDTVAGMQKCNYTDSTTGLRALSDVGIKLRRVDVRWELVVAISALITTNGHYFIDLRWVGTIDAGSLLTPDPFFNGTSVEALWNYNASTKITINGVSTPRVFGKPVCYDTLAQPRAACDASDPSCVSGLVTQVPYCIRGMTGHIESLWNSFATNPGTL